MAYALVAYISGMLGLCAIVGHRLYRLSKRDSEKLRILRERLQRANTKL